MNAADRIVAAGPWYLVDRTTLVFSNKDAFATGPAHAIDTDENGLQVDTAQGRDVWTGRFIAGRCGGEDDCAGWTSTIDSLTGLLGAATSTSSGWTAHGGVNAYCNGAAGSLYCFEE